MTTSDVDLRAEEEERKDRKRAKEDDRSRSRSKEKRSKKHKKNNLNKEKTKGDPISQLGFGIVAYIGMLYYMIWAFSLFSFILIPVFSFYNHGEAYKEAD